MSKLYEMLDNGLGIKKKLTEEVLSDDIEAEVSSIIDSIKELQSTIKYSVVDEMISINARIEELNNKTSLNIEELDDSSIYQNIESVVSDLEYALKDSEWSKEETNESVEITEEEGINNYTIDIYQITDIHKTKYGFMDWDYAKDLFSLKDYKKVDTYNIEASDVNEALEKAFTQGNRPANRNYRSISMSDVLMVDGKAYYTDTFGFKEIPSEKLTEDVNVEIIDPTTTVEPVTTEPVVETNENDFIVANQIQYLIQDESQAIAGYLNFLQTNISTLTPEAIGKIREITADEKEHIEALCSIAEQFDKIEANEE